MTATYVVALYAISSTKRTRWWTLPTISFSLNKTFLAKHMDETHRPESVKTLNCAKKQTDEVLLHPFFYTWVSRWSESLKRVTFHWCHKMLAEFAVFKCHWCGENSLDSYKAWTIWTSYKFRRDFFFISVQVKEKVYNTVNENKRQQRDVSGIVTVRHT